MLEIELYVTVRGYGNAEETMLVGDGLSFIMDSPDDDILNGITDIIGYNTLDNNETKTMTSVISILCLNNSNIQSQNTHYAFFPDLLYL